MLLPPRTALVYNYLLKAEGLELAKDKEAAWDRIIQIRHLKDRMIRKCSRLAKDSSSYDKNTGRVMMFTVHAPPDFRLKEMERWFRDQGSDFVKQVSAPSSSAPFTCSKCGPGDAEHAPHRRAVPQPASAVTSTRTLTRSNTTSARPTTPTRSRSMSQSKSRSRSAGVESARAQGRAAGKASQVARAPERVPKHPSNSSSDTAVEQGPDPVSKPSKRKDAVVQQPTPSNSRSPSASRSASPPAVRPSRVPEVVREPATPPPVTPPSHTPPAVTPQRSEEDLRSQVSARSAASARSLPLRAAIQSPEPLPIPYRPRGRTFYPEPETSDEDEDDEDSEDDEDEDEDEEENEGPQEVPDAPLPQAPLQAAADLEIPRTSSPDSTLIDVQASDVDAPPQNEPPSTGQPLDTIQEQPEVAEPSQRPLVRRRSSLKKRDSMSKLSAASNSKSVTWAMDRDWTEQMSKFVKSTNEAEVSGESSVTLPKDVEAESVYCSLRTGRAPRTVPGGDRHDAYRVPRCLGRGGTHGCRH